MVVAANDVGTYLKPLRSYAARLTGNRHEADDLLNETIARYSERGRLMTLRRPRSCVDALNRRARQRLSTYTQARTLAAFGLSGDVSMGEAFRAIQAIDANGVASS